MAIWEKSPTIVRVLIISYLIAIAVLLAAIQEACFKPYDYKFETPAGEKPLPTVR